MKRIILPAFIFISASLHGQALPGFQTGSAAGVTGVFSNPANIADSRYKWDVNLFSISTSVGNNKATFSTSDFGDNFSGDDLLRRFIGGGTEGSNALINAQLTGPSFMIGLRDKSSIAFTSRARVLMNAVDFDGRLANQLLYPEEMQFSLPYEIRSDKNMRVNINAWSEFGLSYARVLKNDGEHFVKAGVTLKYLAGVTNGYLNVNRLNANIYATGLTDEGAVANASGALAVGAGGVKLDNFEAKDLTSFESSGFGADLGFVYEYRPGIANDELSGWRQDREKYKFRFGASLIDAGKIKYKKDMQRSGGYNVDIDGVEFLDLNELSNQPLDELNQYFAANPDLFTPTDAGPANYKAALPTTLQLDADYHINGGLFVNAGGQISLTDNETKIYNSQYYSGFSLTPRWEGKRLGFYLPLSYNALTDFNAGLAFRFGPVFLGSGSILSAVFGDSKQADAFFGVKFGGLLD
ncbi:MAG: hypothetical protein EOO09_02480 [Chitinophagaceae bacterium]|nr:MAG: hypothetical protein EOO09_02480 [Chitinophagaceae bacterium]